MEEEEKEGSSAMEEEEGGHWSPYTLWRTINDTKDEVKEIKQSLDEIKQLLIQQMPSAGRKLINENNNIYLYREW